MGRVTPSPASGQFHDDNDQNDHDQYGYDEAHCNSSVLTNVVVLFTKANLRDGPVARHGV